MKKTIHGETGAVTVGRRGRGHRSRRERIQWVSEYRASGLTQEQFARRAGLKVGTLRAWIYKMRTPDHAPLGGFAPVRIVDEVRPVKSRGSVTVRWPQGIEVEIAMELDGRSVGRLVRELVQSCLR